jgi:beta-galactosidase
MKIQQFIYSMVSMAAMLYLVSCGSDPSTSYYRNSDFNADWKFHMGDPDAAADPGLNDSDWEAVHLPHDWSIIDYEVQDSLHQGPFFRNLPGGRDVGYLRDGTAWYRKEYITPAKLGDKRIILDFDGVQSQMELWVNGEMVGENVYGYTPFQFDITSALKAAGEPNVIAVNTMNPGENSRWFAGAGIYREVKLSVLNPVSIAPWGVYITTRKVRDEAAVVLLEVAVTNRTEIAADMSFGLSILSPDKKISELQSPGAVAESNSSVILNASCEIENPALWSPEEPNLYKAEVVLLAQGEEVDRYEVMFGIRSIEYGVEDGFLLNGKEILMKGACMHHDNGLLGAAAFKDAEYRRVQVMMENGYNAIRTSHNPPSEYFLNACDELGMLVINESFDHWVEPKRPNDYSNYFEEWHIKDVQAMVYRDRNHPSVVMWSFGNEVKERADPEGIEIGKSLKELIKEVDDTRPVTQAVCFFWDNPGKDWDYSAGAFSMLDLCGYNYTFPEYEADHRKHPDRIMYGSETFPNLAWENWEMVKRHKYVVGDFVWTGMDYIGESGIGHNYLSGKNSAPPSFLKPWPWYISWCGDIDILGNKKPQSYYRDIVWGESNLEIMVSRPVPEGMRSEMSYWGWHDELPHWNWEGQDGRPMHVRVYSSFPELKLELNGETIGTRTLDSADRYIAEFDLPYAAGELKATGIQGGSEMETLSLFTSGDASVLLLEAEQDQITANRNSLVYINVSTLDADGLPVPDHESELKVEIAGPATLQAAGSANPAHQGSFTDGAFHLFRGKGMVILRSTGEPGEIVVEVSSKDLKAARLALNAE